MIICNPILNNIMVGLAAASMSQGRENSVYTASAHCRGAHFVGLYQRFPLVTNVWK